MERRKFLLTTGAVMSTGLAGCSGGGDSSGGDSGNDDGGDDSTPTDSPTPEPTATPTATPEPTATPTATPEPVYNIGEAFTVGSGEQTVEYVVNSVNAYSELGGEYSSEEASGVWVVVTMEMTNQTDETVDISSNHLKLIDDQDRQFDADAGAGVYADSDPRVEASPITFEQLNPGLSTSGAVVFDVNPGTSYELLVEPLGYFSSADSKRVSLGEITAP